MNSQSKAIKNWEDVFPDAILSVEELLNSGDVQYIAKSKLRIALENKILDWELYKKWAMTYYGLPSISKIDETQLIEFQSIYAVHKKHQSENNKSNEDLITLTQWDNQNILLGFDYAEYTATSDCIFILTSPDTLDQIKNETVAQEQFNDSNVFDDEPVLNEQAPPEGFVAAKENVVLSFKDIRTNNPDLSQHVWRNINDNHQDYSFLARKYFDAYVVLRVTADDKTELYKMDEDLEKEELDRKIFSYNLKEQNPFQNVYNNHFTETFNINQLGLKILDFKYACISAIKLGPKVVGFIVGFKTTNLSQDDITTLESISEKAV